MKTLILDTSAFITGFQPVPDQDNYTVSGVLDEIKNQELRLKVELFLKSGLLKIIEPSDSAIARAKKIAEKSGDISALSATDLNLVALASDLITKGLKVSIVTDDYGVQNVASLLSISFMPLAERGIKKVIIWKNICIACKKKFPPEFKEECTFCGSKLKMVKARQCKF